MAQKPETGFGQGAHRVRDILAEAVAEEAAERPGVPIGVLATDDHRFGPRPIVRSVRAPVDERPIALGHHRLEWPYVTASVGPATGETVRYRSDSVCKPSFGKLLHAFAREVGAGPAKRVVPLLDNAGLRKHPDLTSPKASDKCIDHRRRPNCSLPRRSGTWSTSPSATRIVLGLDELHAIVDA